MSSAWPFLLVFLLMFFALMRGTRKVPTYVIVVGFAVVVPVSVWIWLLLTTPPAHIVPAKTTLAEPHVLVPPPAPKVDPPLPLPKRIERGK